MLTRARRAGRQRGFTLVEMLIVVAMVGVLAALGLVGYKKYMTSARGSEATSILSGIRAGQEAFRAETLSYLNCSLSNKFYPQAGTPNDKKWNFKNPGHPDKDCFLQLNVQADAPVMFGFKVFAGSAGTAMTNVSPPFVSSPAWPAPTTDIWYVAFAQGDPEGKGVKHLYLMSSLTGEAYYEQQ